MLQRQSDWLWPSRRDLDQLRREMDRLMAGLPSMGASRDIAGYPPINVYADKNGALVTAEVPGIDPQDLDIAVVDNLLTITGQRETIALDASDVLHRRERGSGRFTRSFQLPYSVEPDDVVATYEKGILSVTLPRAQADKPRKITVKTA